MDWRAHIGIDAGVLGGKPVIHGTRLAVDFVVSLLAQGWSVEQLLESYADSLSGERVFPRAS